jgi:hypothetical protein
MSASEALKDAKIITSSLRKAKRAMEYGVLQADTAVNMLSRDGEVINQTVDNQKNVLKNSLDSSKRRLHIVKNMHIIEKWSLRISLLFFSLVVSYVIGRRLRIFQLSGFILKHGLTVDISPLYKVSDMKIESTPATVAEDLPYRHDLPSNDKADEIAEDSEAIFDKYEPRFESIGQTSDEEAHQIDLSSEIVIAVDGSSEYLENLDSNEFTTGRGEC